MPWPGAISTGEWTAPARPTPSPPPGRAPAARTSPFAAPDVSKDADPPQSYGGPILAGQALASEVMLAWAMNGQPLTAAHGAPVRIVVPGYIGARSVKWVQRVTLPPGPSDNYFEAVAYRPLPAARCPLPAARRG
jgi:sulfite oxidase